jgi:hypothetical protein
VAVAGPAAAAVAVGPVAATGAVVVAAPGAAVEAAAAAAAVAAVAETAVTPQDSPAAAADDGARRRSPGATLPSDVLWRLGAGSPTKDPSLRRSLYDLSSSRSRLLRELAASDTFPLPAGAGCNTLMQFP